MSVKVTDRRKFSSDGKLRDEGQVPQNEGHVPREAEPQAAAPSQAPVPADPAPPAREESAPSPAPVPADPALAREVSAPSQAPTTAATAGSPDPGDTNPTAKVDFQSFVYFLYMSALQELGIPTQEGVAPRPADLERARFFVDVLDLLERKTKGNLEPGETKLLEEALYNLRLQYLGVSKAKPA